MIIRSNQEWPSVFRFFESRKQEPVPKGGLEILIRKPRRSNAQNRYLWGVVYKTVAEGLSERYQQHITPKMIHDLCKQSFMPRVMVPGLNKEIPMSTTDLCRSGNENSFQDYVLQIQELAAQRDIYVPDPNEEIYEQMAREVA